MFYEEFNGQYGDEDYEQLYSPITLCIISQHPFYTFFSQYLRELYRLTIEGNAIDLSESNQQFLFNLRRVSAKPITLLYTKDDEDDEKDKDILSPSSKSNESNLQIPVECYISNLINGYNNVNIEDDGILIKYHIGKRVMECIKPPVDTSLSSILDDECYRSLFHILSIENIITIYECLLLQHKIIFHSKQIENLTLISECLLNLLYPLNWTMCYVSLLPLQLIQCLESPFPYCIGVHSCFLDTDIANECIENCVIVYLDSNRVTVPKVIKNNITHLPNELINILISNLKEITPKPMITVLEEDIDSNYVIFDVIFGPGKIGIKFSTTSCILHKEDTKKVHVIQVVGFEKYDDEKNQSPAEKCGSITTDSLLIAINGKSVVNVAIDKVIEMLKTLPRPVVLRFQIGIRPQSMITPTTETSTPTTTVSSTPPTTPTPPPDTSSPNTLNTSPTSIPSPPVASLSRLPPLAPSSLKHLHPSPNSTSSLSSTSLSSILSNNNSNITSTSSIVDNDSDTDSQHHYHHHHKHHRRGSSVIGNSYLFSENFKENLWVDKVRSVFLYIMIQLLGDYEHYIVKDKEDPKYPFDSEKYLSSISSNKSKLLFMKQLKDTQSFTSFIEDHLNEVIDNDLQAFISFSREVLNNNNNNAITPSPLEENETEPITERRGRKSSIANLFGLGLNSNNNIAMEQHKQAIDSIYEKINRLNWKIKLYEVEDIKFEQLQSFISNNNIRIEIPITGIFPRFNYQLFDSIKRKDIEFKPFMSNRKDIEIKRNKSQTMDILLNPDRKSSSMSGSTDITINKNERSSISSSGSNVDKDIAIVKSRYSLNFNFNFKKSYVYLYYLLYIYRLFYKRIMKRKFQKKKKKKKKKIMIIYLVKEQNSSNQ